MELTNKEASEWLIAIKRDYIYGGDEDYDERRKLALDMGAEALENQKSIIEELEDIKSKITQKQWYIGVDSANQVIDIIDKHIKEIKTDG